MNETQYLVTGCNEVVNFVNVFTNEIKTKVYDREAKYGHVTCLKVNDNLLAVGFSSGTIIVYDLKEGLEEELHRFSVHKSAITCI